MNDNYKYLGTISAIYDFNNADENYYITLTVFNNNSDLKIIYNELAISGQSKNADNGEIILNNIGEVEFDIITHDFSETLIKELILAKYLDNRGDHLNFEIVY